MATVAASGVPSLASVLPPQSQQLAGLLAGEAITAGMPCYIKAADGKVYKSIGTTTDVAATVMGWAAETCAIGEAVTLFFDVNLRYGAGMTPGTRVYVGATAGVLADAATTGGTAPVGFAVDATRLHVWQSRY